MPTIEKEKTLENLSLEESSTKQKKKKKTKVKEKHRAQTDEMTN